MHIWTNIGLPLILSTKSGTLLLTRPCVNEAVRNLAVMDGDASKVLPERCAEGSISELFINFPEPPLWSGGGSRQSLHAHVALCAFSPHTTIDLPITKWR